MPTTAIRVGRGLLWFVYAWVTIVVIMLFLAFLLQLFGANPDAGFVEWVYRSVERSMAPFRGIFEPLVLSDQSVLDISILFAIIVYVFVALGLHAAIDWISDELQMAEHKQRPQDLLAAQAVAGATLALAPTQIVQLANASGASASILLTPYAWGTSVEITAAGLDPSRSYGVWLASRGGGRGSAGSFQPDVAGRAQLTLTSSVSLAESQSIGITLLPLPGEIAGVDILATPLG